MLYRRPIVNEPIRQGDIFRAVPKIDFNPSNATLVDESGYSRTSWPLSATETDDEEDLTFLVVVRPVTAIVVTQDCDALRQEFLTLCEINDFRIVERKAEKTKDAKGWVSLITRQARVNLKWFYLPPDPSVGFSIKMAVDFRSTLSVQRGTLEDMVQEFRVASLTRIAREHFRERLSEFLRRYPYDEWYSLNREEFQAYQRQLRDVVQPFPWQRP